MLVTVALHKPPVVTFKLRILKFLLSVKFSVAEKIGRQIFLEKVLSTPTPRVPFAKETPAHIQIIAFFST